MMLFAIWIKRSLNVAVQCSHDADPRKHRRPARRLEASRFRQRRGEIAESLWPHAEIFPISGRRRGGPETGFDKYCVVNLSSVHLEFGSIGASFIRKSGLLRE
jgi:hypothetical protein